MTMKGGSSKIEAGNFTALIYQHKQSPMYFEHTDLEILEMIFQRLDGIDIDLIYGIFHALDGKHLTPSDWQKLIELVREFEGVMR